MIGIYKIQNKINNKVYIGQSINIEGRLKQHFRNAFNTETHTYDYPLSRAIRKYGLENFLTEVLEEVAAKDLTSREQFWIDTYNSLNEGYNQEPAVDSKKGENSNWSVLTDEETLRIIDLLKNTTIAMTTIGEQFGVSGSCIEDINKGRRRVISTTTYPIRAKTKSLTHRGELQNTAILTENQVFIIRNRYVNETPEEIYEDFKNLISWSGFKKICYGATWKHIPCYKKREKIWVYPE